MKYRDTDQKVGNTEWEYLANLAGGQVFPAFLSTSLPFFAL